MDWPAKWAVHGVTCEPFGKDHAASGGSYSTGRQLVDLLGAQPPIPVPYEWIQLKGMGPMSSSTNVIVGPLEALDIVPPEILRFLISSNKPKRHSPIQTLTTDKGVTKGGAQEKLKNKQKGTLEKHEES